MLIKADTFAGNYSCLVAKFHLSRSVGFHMVQTYIPSILIVVISWVSFWMDVDSVAGRTTLGVTTLLTVSSKSAGKKGRANRRHGACVQSFNKLYGFFVFGLAKGGPRLREPTVLEEGVRAHNLYSVPL